MFGLYGNPHIKVGKLKELFKVFSSEILNLPVIIKMPLRQLRLLLLPKIQQTKQPE
jgi:hypothetical protein